jgi:hypothetical protein
VAENEEKIAVTRSQTVGALEFPVPLERMRQREEITTVCYENEIPHFVEAALDRRYGSLFSSLLHFRIKQRLTPRTSTYVSRRGDEIVSILLFEHEAGKVTVFNDLIDISEEEIRQFADYIFAAYGSVTTICFPAIRTHLQHFPYPRQQFFSAEDIVVALPDNIQTYFKNLSKKKRENIKYYRNQLTRKFPSFEYRILPAEEISEELIRHIIDFNKVRMADKNKVSTINDEEERWIIALAKTCGLVGVVTIDGRVCAASICCRVADNYYLLVIGHVPEYNEFSLGTLCCYQTICACIERGGKELHFMWGRLDYKHSFLGVQRGYDRVDIYRTRAAFLRNAMVVMKTAVTGHIREAKFRLLDCERRDDAQSKIVKKLLNALRRSKRTVLGFVSKSR